jgi:hypothetical protein
MRSRTTIAALAATAAFAAVPASASARAQSYEFRGHVAAVTSSSIVVQVGNGNRPALRAMLGAAQPLTFPVDGRTRYTTWSVNHPRAGTLNDIGVGDAVWIRTFGRPHADLGRLLSHAVRAVHDVTDKNLGQGRLFLFRGICTAKDTAGNHLTVTVQSGSWWALKAMLGQPVSQTFTYDDSTAILSWQSGRPRPVTEDAIPCGADGTRVAVRLRARRDTPLSTLVSTPAAIVNVRDPIVSDEPSA